MIKNIKKHDYITYAVIFAMIILLALSALSSSPLFRGIVHKDSCVFQVMAKGLLNNKILYKELFDHKGPIVYIINAIGILLNKNMGLFMIEVILLWIGTIYVYKTSRLMLDNIKSIMICSIYCMLIFCFIGGGNYTEEYAIVFSSIALYYIIFLKFFIRKKLM